jgi:flagellar biosynthesis protein FlhB
MMRPFGRKGMSEKVLTIITSLVIAIIALAILWYFLVRFTPTVSEAVENAITGFKKMLCSKGILSGVCNWLLGA